MSQSIQLINLDYFEEHTMLKGKLAYYLSTPCSKLSESLRYSLSLSP